MTEKKTYMTEGRKKARLKRMLKAMKTPPSYLSEKSIKEKEEWKNTTNDGLVRY